MDVLPGELKMTWDDVISEVLLLGPHEELLFPSGPLPHPSMAGFTRHLGVPVGQTQDWRLTLADGIGLHVRTYPNGYGVHWDHVCPLERPLTHGFVDVPVLAAAACLAFVLVVGGFAAALE